MGKLLFSLFYSWVDWSLETVIFPSNKVGHKAFMTYSKTTKLVNNTTWSPYLVSRKGKEGLHIGGRWRSFSMWQGNMLQSFLSHNCTFCGFSYSLSTGVWKYEMEISSNKQVICFQLHTILSNVVKSHTFHLRASQDVKYPFVQCLQSLYAVCPPLSPLIAVLAIKLTVGVSQCCVEVTLTLLHNDPKAQE